MPPIRLLIVVPTRNRAALARAAITSALNDAGPVHVLVSDNSTQAFEADQLAAFCAGLDTTVVPYVRPPQPLPMTAHWEWALNEGLRERPTTTHVLYLTDRMVFKRGALAHLLAVAGDHPSSIISYNHDRIEDSKHPVVLEEREWTGNVYAIPSAHLLALTARAIIPPCLPRMLNSIVPVPALDRVRSRFGSVFGSIAPDYAFAYRALASLDAILYYDAPLLVHYALDRSNGATYARGIASSDHLDFISNLGGATHNGMAPEPAFHTATNPMFHEYAVVRAALKDQSLPPIDRFEYLGMMAFDAREIVDPEIAAETARLLHKRGWRRTGRLRWVLRRAVPYVVADPVGVVLRTLRRPRRFPTVEAALDYANAHPLPPRQARHFYRWFLDESAGVRRVQAASASTRLGAAA